MISVPMFAVGLVLCMVNFDIIWRYFAWANQTLASVMLWAAAAYMIKRGKLHWIATLPAMFMTAMCMTYFANAKIGLNLPMDISTWVGLACAAAATVAFFTAFRPSRLGRMATAQASARPPPATQRPAPDRGRAFFRAFHPDKPASHPPKNTGHPVASPTFYLRQ